MKEDVCGTKKHVLWHPLMEVLNAYDMHTKTDARGTSEHVNWLVTSNAYDTHMKTDARGTSEHVNWLVTSNAYDTHMKTDARGTKKRVRMHLNKVNLNV